MKRLVGPFILVTMLALCLGLGAFVWENLHSPSCMDRQSELGKRVESYARLHLSDRAPQVQVQGVCGHAVIADALYFRWQNLNWRLGLRKQRPMQDADLRLLTTRELMQHPDMGTLKFTVRFDPLLDGELRQKVEDLISHYLVIEEPRQKLEFRKQKRWPDPPATLATEAQEFVLALLGKVRQDPAASAQKVGPRPGFESMEPQLKLTLQHLKNMALIVLLLLSALWSIQWSVKFISKRLQKSRKPRVVSTSAADGNATWPILFAPRAARDMAERGRELWQLLDALDPPRAKKRVAIWWEKDREGLLHFLVLLDAPTQESILASLSMDQMMLLSDSLSVALSHHRDSHRAALRPLLDLGRELAQCSKIKDAPLFLHLMTRQEWQRVAQHLTRPRRSALAEVLDKQRASWLRTRQDLHPAWFQSGSKEALATQQLCRRVRSILQVEADQLREQLHIDREAILVIDSYFAELTLDASLNSDLAMLVLGQCHAVQAGFGRLVERRDLNLQTALLACDNQQLALLLYEMDPQLQAAIYQQVGPRQGPVAAALAAIEQDKAHCKSLRMQARSLQRFVERQVLIADLLCAPSGQ